MPFVARVINVTWLVVALVTLDQRVLRDDLVGQVKVYESSADQRHLQECAHTPTHVGQGFLDLDVVELDKILAGRLQNSHRLTGFVLDGHVFFCQRELVGS